MIPKFRVWLKDVKEMYTVITMHIEHEKVICEHWRFGETVPLSYRDDKDVVLMQSTGLIDVWGGEIYEGDIVKVLIQDIEPEILKNKMYVGVMDYKQGMFDIKNFENIYLGIIPQIYMSDINFEFEVLGNIYQNSELMEELE